jgi:hypothetical protein
MKYEIYKYDKMIRGQEDKRTRGRDENQTKKITVDLM